MGRTQLRLPLDSWDTHVMFQLTAHALQWAEKASERPSLWHHDGALFGDAGSRCAWSSHAFTRPRTRVNGAIVMSCRYVPREVYCEHERALIIVQ
jgi:hypothetical protein